MTTTTMPARPDARGDAESAVRAYFADLDRTQGNVSTIERYCTPDFVAHVPGAPPLDAAGFAGFGGAFYGGFPGLAHTIEEAVAAGDRVVVRLRIRGTQSGAFQGMPPTGRATDFTAMTMARLRDGKIAEMWIEGDFLGMMQQLGAIPAPGAPPA
jgi:predicted ester cyclase